MRITRHESSRTADREHRSVFLLVCYRSHQPGGQVNAGRGSLGPAVCGRCAIRPVYLFQDYS
jgi:hypothetical protein